MPKQNPKHMKKRVGLERQQSLVDGSFPTRYLVMALIFIAAVTTIIVLVVTLNNNDNEDNITKIVENEDYVILEYKIWKNPDRLTNAELTNNRLPDFSSKMERNVSKTEIVPLGLYNFILGKEIGPAGYFSIEGNLDENGDGIDDITGDPVLGYGKSRSDFYNVRLTFYVEILNITKGIKNAPKSSGIEPSESMLQSLNDISLIDDLFILNDLF